jgi:hypothetical protein
MKKKHLLLLLAVAVVVGLAGVFFQVSQYAGWNDSKTDRTIYQNLAVNDVTKIELRSAPASVTLEKKGDEWGVAEREGYPADFTKIRDLIKLLWGLKSGQETQIGPSQLGRLKLLTPGQGADTGIEINLKGTKDVASLIIGKSVERSNATAGSPATGRFVYNPAVKDRVYLVSETFFSVDPVSVGAWLDKTFIAPGDLREIDQAAWSNNPGWKVVRKEPKAEWQLVDSQPGENLDKSLGESFSTFAPTFVDVRPLSVSPEESGLKDPFKVTVKTFDGFTYDLLLGKGGPEKARYLQLTVSAELPSVRTPDPNEKADEKKKKDEEFDQKLKSLKERLEREKRFEKWVYLVPDYNLEQILKRRNEILAKATPSTSPAVLPSLPEPASSPAPTLLPEPISASTPTPPASESAIPSPPTPSPAPSLLPESTPSAFPSPTASESAAPSVPSASPSPTPLPESTPTSSPTPTASESAAPSPTPNPTPALLPDSTPAAPPAPTASESATPSPLPNTTSSPTPGS